MNGKKEKCCFSGLFNLNNMRLISSKNQVITLCKVSILSICMVFLLASTAPADTMPLEQLTSKMQSTYENTQDFKANFTQELVIKSIGKTEREEGTVYFKNPGKMLWDYVKPKAKKLVINPQKASLYVPADRAVYVQDSANIYKSKVIIRFLSGIGKLGDDFEIKYSEPEAVDKEGRYLLTLVPKSPDLGVEKLFLVIEPASFRILQCSFTDSFGNLTRIRFRNIRINSRLPDRLFSFKPPRGVEIHKVP
jgi:outer membrane lipoprotein carrier protein